MKSILLNPGDIYCCEGHGRIHTLLGSCIAVTLWHETRRFGWMCHYLLPKRPQGEAKASRHTGFYADEAFRHFDAVISDKGLQASNFVAKIFGGSNALSIETANEDNLIGVKNTNMAVELVNDRNIPLLVAHVGETGYRKIIFDVANGDVWVQHQPFQKIVPGNE